MNKIFSTYHIVALLLAMCAVVLCGCDNRENVVGQWQTAMRTDDVPGVEGAHATDCFVFGQDGRVMLTTNLHLSHEMTAMAGIDSVNIAATATIEGTWRYATGKSNEVDITYDPATFAVSIDPDSVYYIPMPADTLTLAAYDLLKGNTIEVYTERLAPGLRAYYAGLNHLRNIRVDKGVMKCDANNNTFVMRGI